MRVFILMLLLSIGATFCAQAQISGHVQNSSGKGLEGAAVYVKKVGKGVITEADGSFKIGGLADGEYQLRISYVGYETKFVEVRLDSKLSIDVELVEDEFFAEEVFVYATRAAETDPITYSTVSKEQIESQNFGQDIPYLLSLTPSFVASSDAGTGIGYSTFRIRGTDDNRVNITVNGIPLNDAESHVLYWVNLPDLASSVENLQIQRGVGNSTNGAAAFGASLNMQTSSLEPLAYASYSGSYGSFNTQKHTIKVGSGLLNDHFSIDARLSKVSSDGYIDRAFSNLKSFFISGGYYADGTVIRMNVFSGEEHTYQAWNGVPSVRLNNDVEGMKLYEEHGHYSSAETTEMLNSNSRTYNLYTYDNETDNYLQTHYQLMASQQLSKSWIANVALHYTNGAGYYEQYKADQKFSKYNLPNLIIGDTEIKRTDLIRQKALDSDFYGLTFSVNNHSSRSDFTFGGAYNEYRGNHFGDFVWMRYAGDTSIGDEWYRNKGAKNDFNLYAKYNYSISSMLNLYADMQYRKIDQTIEGIDDDLRDISQEHSFDFFNPKLGFFFHPTTGHEGYFSWSVGNREPNRSNYTDADPSKPEPVSERVFDYELGYRITRQNYAIGANLYFMDYTDQLILTGEINDVGSSIMSNVDDSYRAGVEFVLGAKIFRSLTWDLNLTLSRNKILNFVEYVDNWDTGLQTQYELGTTNIAFSPEIICNSLIKYTPLKDLSLSLASSYVGKQYIDNSSSEERKLDPYIVNNLCASYHFSSIKLIDATISLRVNNLFDEMYESNAWVYSYILGDVRYKTDGYFPQAGRNFMVGLDVRF